MNWRSLRGRQRQREMFQRSIQRGRLASAYLFIGPEGVGKSLFARWLSQCLLCERRADADCDSCGECSSCRQMQSASHPDFLSVGCADGKKEITIGQIAGDDEKRGREGLCFELSMRPMSSDRRIAIIDGADLMNDAAANAFLKTLEEPPPYALLFLIASNPDGLLTTIRSRCQAVHFGPLSSDDVAAILIEKELTTDPDEARLVAGLSEGSVSTAAQLLDPRFRQIRERLFTQLSAERFQSVALAKELADAIDDLGGDAAAHRLNAVRLLRFALEFFRMTMSELAGRTANDRTAVPQVLQLIDRHSTDQDRLLLQTMKQFDRCSQAVQQIEIMTPILLSLEAMCDDMSRLRRP